MGHESQKVKLDPTQESGVSGSDPKLGTGQGIPSNGQALVTLDYGLVALVL